MEHSTLQSSTHKNFCEKAERSREYHEINTFIWKIFTNMQVNVYELCSYLMTVSNFARKSMRRMSSYIVTMLIYSLSTTSIVI
jgi:hypothetical protein